MPTHAVAALLREARAYRARAARARGIAVYMSDQGVMVAMTDYADELDKGAAKLEHKAEEIETTAAAAQEIVEILHKLLERLQEVADQVIGEISQSKQLVEGLRRAMKEPDANAN